MSENGSTQQTKTNIWRVITDQITDHVDLAALELRYEAQEAGKRLFAVAAIFILVLTGFIVLQVAAVGWLMRAGLSLGNAALVLSLSYFVMAGVVYMVLGRRNKNVGPPFLGTQREIHETLRWIRKIFS